MEISAVEHKLTDNLTCRILEKNDEVVRIEFMEVGKPNEIKEYKNVDVEVIYKKIDNKEEINLDECYIQDFSLSDYRRDRGMDISDIIFIEGFSAQKAFFSTQSYTDFSYVTFGKGYVDFRNVIFKEGYVSFMNATFGEGNVDFQGSTFGKGLGFRNVMAIHWLVNFRNTTFGKGHVNFSQVTFGEANVSFAGATFGKGTVSFIWSNFGKGNVNFKGANFGKGNISFTEATLEEGRVSFENVTFGDGNVKFREINFGKSCVDFRDATFGDGDVDFKGATFGKGRVGYRDLFLRYVSFQNTIFGKGDVNFSAAYFGEAEVIFKNTIFGEGNVDFSYATFEEGYVDFSAATFGEGNMDFSGVKAEKTDITFQNSVFMCYINLRLESCKLLEIMDCKVEKVIDMSWSKEFPVDIKALNLKGTINLGQIRINWERNKVKKIINSKLNNTNYEEKAEQFRLLKEDFSNIGQHDDEDAAYVEFKRCERRSRFWGEHLNIKNSFFRIVYTILTKILNPLYWFEILVFDWIGGYSTKPRNVFISMLLTIISFAIAYLYVPLMQINFTNSKISNDIVKAVYYSGITFLTIGYGDISPHNELTAIASVIEGFLGIFLMSYFTASFVRKLLR
ncbi:potassium channel family protein [Wukongibacter baidiensis]